MKFLFVIAVLFSVTCLPAQTLLLKDAKNTKPLEGATVVSNNANAVTNSKGEANLDAFSLSAIIEIRLLGYESLIVNFQDLKDSNFIIYLNEERFGLDQVVLSATKWRQSSAQVASKIVRISSKEVQLQNPQTAADLLGISGKVFIQKSQQGGGSPMIRGFATNRLVYTVDGVRMNTAIFRSGNIQNVINLDPFATESTEVLFGPNSVIYGSDAIGGVMSFTTLSPSLSTTDKALVKGNALARYASANHEKTAHVDVNVGWKKWALVTSFSSWDYDHLRQGRHGPDDYLKPTHVERQNDTDVVVTQEDELLQVPSAYSQTNFMQKIRFKANKHWDFQYALHYSETSPYGRYDRHNRVRNNNPRYAEWNYGPQSWMMNHLNITHQSNQKFYDNIQLKLAYQRFGESRISRDFNNPLRQTRTEDVKAYSVNLDVLKQFSNSQLFYGLEYVTNDVNSKGTRFNINTESLDHAASRYPNAKWSSLAFYSNYDISLNDKLNLQSGIRYNFYKLKADFSNNSAFYPFPFSETTLNNAALTGSLGLVYRPNQTWALRTNLGTAFRSPNVDDIGKVFDSEPGAVVVPNPNLKAEYAYNIDIGVTKIFKDLIKLDLTGFYTHLDNAMVRRDFTINGEDTIIYDGELSRVQALQNAANAYVYGLQAGLEVKLPSGFALVSDLNYQIGEEETDDGVKSPSRHAAPLFGISRLRYLKDNLTLEFNVAYQGEVSHEDLAISERNKTEIYALDANGNTYAPSWYTLNLKAMYQLTPQLTLTGGFENLTNQRYRPYSSGISGAGRNVILAIQAKFL